MRTVVVHHRTAACLMTRLLSHRGAGQHPAVGAWDLHLASPTVGNVTLQPRLWQKVYDEPSVNRWLQRDRNFLRLLVETSHSSSSYVRISLDPAVQNKLPDSACSLRQSSVLGRNWKSHLNRENVKCFAARNELLLVLHCQRTCSKVSLT